MISAKVPYLPPRLSHPPAVIFHKWVLGFVPLYPAEWFYPNKSSCYPAPISPSDFILRLDAGNQWDPKLAKCFVCVWNLNIDSLFESLSIQSVIFEFRSGVNLSFNISLEVCTLARLQHGNAVCAFLSVLGVLRVSVRTTSLYSVCVSLLCLFCSNACVVIYSASTLLNWALQLHYWSGGSGS